MERCYTHLCHLYWGEMALICVRKIYRNYIGSITAEKGSWQRDGVSVIHDMCFPGGSAVKNMLANVRDVGLIPWIGGSPGEGNGKTFQDSCLGNSVDRGAWWATVCGITSQTTFHN